MEIKELDVGVAWTSWDTREGLRSLSLWSRILIFDLFSRRLARQAPEWLPMVLERRFRVPTGV